MRVIWVSTPNFTFKFKVDNSYKIIDSAPIIKKFVGQKIENLISWIDKLCNGHYTLIQVNCPGDCIDCNFTYCHRNIGGYFVNEQQANAETTYHEQPERPNCSNCNYYLWEYDNIKHRHKCTLSPNIKPNPDYGICAEWKNENLPT